ncbi:probable protein phosphatase 2C 72 [Juglans microcarpa x Juglans regia]|uniref:probable protein phosphatase 2C 72 n=1 Tax=Juglans microcarpa x Juglans regia TaxID=2249226 RepID=UPI001B7E485D|nr:probable protein phosphatase 2C 72 [Juglans microcarpa x Juglans regia]
MAVSKASLMALLAVTFAVLSLFGAAQAQTLEAPAPSPTSPAVSTSPSLAFAFLGSVVALAFGSGRRAWISTFIVNDQFPFDIAEAEKIRNCNGRVAALNHEPHIQRVWLPHDDTPGLAMPRAFGDFILKDHGIIAIPDIKYHRLTPNDQFIILATDESEQAAARVVAEAATTAWKKEVPYCKSR